MSATNGQDRPVVFLGMPCNGGMTSGAGRGFYFPVLSSNRFNVHRKTQESSLLALNMNHLWCWALNAAHRGERLDYFAMIHSDIEPQYAEGSNAVGWLEVLIDELEAKDLDVLGVVAPIKDQEGKTSIALAHPSGDPFEVLCRLTMREIYRLPETFTSEDVGHPLLLNTGLWVMRWGEWCKGLYFTVNDEIVFVEDKCCYLPRVESEDWFLSRLFHEAGLKVGCTRKIQIGHVGPARFGNHMPWGSLEFDSHHVKKSVLDDVEVMA